MQPFICIGNVFCIHVLKKDSTAVASWWDRSKGVNVKRRRITQQTRARWYRLKIIWGCFKIIQQCTMYIWMFWSSSYAWLVSISISCNRLYFFFFFVANIKRTFFTMPPAFCHKADLLLFCLELQQRIKTSYHLPQWASDGFKAHICAECCSLLVLSPWTHWSSKRGNQVDFDKWKPGRNRLKELKSMFWW